MKKVNYWMGSLTGTAILATTMFVSPVALAANTGDLPCKTTKECNEQAAKLTGLGGKAAAQSAQARKGQAPDRFDWINKINKASVVMLMEKEIFSPQQGTLMSKGVDHVIKQASEANGKRPSDVLQIERIMSDLVGPEVSVIHAGRSRQDMYMTFGTATLRDQLLSYADALIPLRERMLALASDNLDTLIPAYTNGVQAVPITYGHYLLAYEASFGRDQNRIAEAYARINRSPMGSGVLSNSVWPLDRERMAQLLGFDGIIENSLDSSQVAPFGNQLEAAGIAQSNAIRIGVLMQDLHTQYHQTKPWLLLHKGSTYSSSSMPQKRNPGIIMGTRMKASDVVGLAQAAVIRAHNVTTGMVDYKAEVQDFEVLTKATAMAQAANRVFGALVVDKARARAELDSDWTSTMNLAEVLLKDHKVAFRVGHGFASLLVSYARPLDLTPTTIPFDAVKDTFAKALAKYKLPAQDFPMSEARFREVMSPDWIVKHTQSTGGPQPAEVQRMLAQAQKRLVNDRKWLSEQHAKLKQADADLDLAFSKILNSNSAR